MTRNDLKIYFVERFQELLNRNTIDSYRVRCNNVLSLICELRDVIENWLKGYVQRFETVCLCAEETLAAMKEDDILDYSIYDKQLMIDDLTALLKADQKTRGELGNQTIYLLDKCICSNKNTYLDRLYTAINEILEFNDDIKEEEFYHSAEKLNKLTGALACELLNERFSLRHLYRESVKLKDKVAVFSDAFAQFKQAHYHQVPFNDYIVVLKMNGGKNKRLTSLQGFSSTSPEHLVPECSKTDKTSKFLTNRGGLFYHTQVEAHDSSMAVTMAVEQMESVLDKAMLGYSILDVRVQKEALVVRNCLDEKICMVQSISVTDTSYADDKQVVSNMIDKISQIQNNGNISVDVKDRLTSALRHLRIGNMEVDTGQQLVNYWVALEFIFSSPKAIDSTISRLEKNLLNILMCCYANRRMTYINELIHKNGTLDAQKDWWRLSDAELHNLIANQTNLLVRFHLQEMKSAIRGNKDAVKAFFSTHKKHLYWHLYRIYRYRNRLIHEAAILPGLENVIRCQRFYLVLLLNQLIGFFTESTVENLTMDSFFFEYAQKYNLLISIVKQEQSAEERVQKIMNINVYNELIRQHI